MFYTDHSITIDGRILKLEKPLVMGILNVTPDSFYEGSRVERVETAVERAERMIADGADILDIGGCSTRPGSQSVTEEEERRRLKEPLREIRRRFPDAILSVDTFRASVARWSVEQFGVQIINDVSGGADPEMADAVCELKVAYVLMHTRGTPATMQSLTDYGDVTAEVLSELAFKLDKFRSRGACNVIVDPGFGFAKTLRQNYRLMADLEMFRALEAPILVGISRKSMITGLTGASAEDSLAGTIALNTIAAMKGADILRVHDVKETAESLKIINELNKE